MPRHLPAFEEKDIMGAVRALKAAGFEHVRIVVGRDCLVVEPMENMGERPDGLDSSRKTYRWMFYRNETGYEAK